MARESRPPTANDEKDLAPRRETSSAAPGRVKDDASSGADSDLIGTSGNVDDAIPVAEAGGRRGRREPERTCIVTREVRAPGELIRFVLGPDGDVVPDLRHRLPGRGAYVTASHRFIAEAVKRRLFARAFKTEVKVAPDLADQIDQAMLRDLRQALALANKAGKVVTGFGKVESTIRDEPLAAVIHAREAAEDGRRKLAGALRKRFGDAISPVQVIDVLSGDDLDLALGRTHVIHAALVAGAGSDGFLARWHQLRVYREPNPIQAGLPRETGPTDDYEPAGNRAE